MGLARSLCPEDAPEPLWTPLPGPQTRALESQADELFYGGQAGGGKTDLLIGLGLTQHRDGIIFRREFKQLKAIIKRGRTIVGARGHFNGQDYAFHVEGRELELGGIQHDGDEEKYQGRPHDFIGFDEGPHFTLEQYLFLTGWLRTTIPGQRTRIVLTGNPPTDVEGEWIVERFAPWLDDTHPNPAEPGELRWFATISGKDTERNGPEPFWATNDQGEPELIYPRSRTFIPAALADNPYLNNSPTYRATLQSLPEPLRSQLLYGDFNIGRQDDPWQVIPTDWIRAAQARWTPEIPTDDDDDPLPQSQVAADIAQGGGDRTVIGRRHNEWVAELEVHDAPGRLEADVNADWVDDALDAGGFAVVDANGIGEATYHLLKARKRRVRPFLGNQSTNWRDKARVLNFVNVRAAAYWQVRCLLDPTSGNAIALPPDRELRVELAAPRYGMLLGGVALEKKDEIIKRLGRSPDKADTVAMLFWNDPRYAAAEHLGKQSKLRTVAKGKKPQRQQWQGRSMVQ